MATSKELKIDPITGTYEKSIIALTPRGGATTIYYPGKKGKTTIPVSMKMIKNKNTYIKVP
jgi:hypothetical protein